MPAIRFSVCPGCDCKSFDFYDTTGQQPGIVSGYIQNADLSLYEGEVIFRDVTGAIRGTFSTKPTPDASKPQSVLYVSDPTQTIEDGAYEVQYIVRDAQGSIVGDARQPVVIACDLKCGIEKLLQQAAASSGRSGQGYLDRFNEAQMRLRNAMALIAIGESAAANSQLKLAQEYV